MSWKPPVAKAFDPSSHSACFGCAGASGSSIEDLLTSDDSVDMRKATIMLWKNRDKPEVISELAEVLSEVGAVACSCTASHTGSY